jgi:hypothetical protein
MADPRVSEVVSDVYVVSIGRGAFSTNVYLIRSGSTWTLVDAGWSGSEKKLAAASRYTGAARRAIPYSRSLHSRPSPSSRAGACPRRSGS